MALAAVDCHKEPMNTMTRSLPAANLFRSLASTLPLLVALSRVDAGFDVPVAVPPGATAVITLAITVTDGVDSETDVDSILVAMDGNGRFTISPNQPPHNGVVIQEGRFGFSGGTLRYDLFCSPIFGCVPVTVNLAGLSATLVAPSQATIIPSGRADFGTTWRVRGDYTITSPFSSSAGALDVNSLSPFGGTFAIGGGAMQVSQLTIGAIDSQTTVDALPGLTFLLHTEVAFGNTTMVGTYSPPPPDSCGTGANCGLEHQGPGCNDINCCSAVCAADPSCCASDWDVLCVNQAAVLCGIAPEHDNCAAPKRLGFGRIPFTTRNCNTDGPLLITECSDVQTGGAFTNDVWFVCTAPFDNGIAVSTCGHAGFDTRLAVYDACNGMLLACGDDAFGCPGGTSRTAFQGVAGESYLIRVGGKNVWGDGEIDLSLVDITQPWPTTVAATWPASAGGNGHAYAVVSFPSPTPFAEVADRATELGGYLATITSEAELSFVRSGVQIPTFGGSTALGLVQGAGAEPAGGWAWITGEPLVWTNWSVGEPNDAGGEDFASIYPDGSWNDQGELFGYALVEFDVPPSLQERTWSVDEGGTGQRYRSVIAPMHVTWQQAAAAAEAIGGTLAVLETPEEANWVFREMVSFPALWSMTPYNGGPWVGLRKDVGSPAWTWLGGSPLVWNPWTPGEPSGFGDVACFYSFQSGPRIGLDDTWAQNQRRGFIVELPAQAACPADLDDDGQVSGSDLARVLGAWGACSACPTDLTGDGLVSGADLAVVLGSWGDCP